MSHASLENQQIKQQLRELVAQVQDNHAILERFQKFELSLLSAENIADLLEVLLYKSMRHFDLSDCRLIWFDREQSLRPLVDEIIRQQFGHRLVFSNMAQDVENLFGIHLKPILRALTPIEKTRWFPGKTYIESAAFIPLVCNGVLVGSFNLASPDLQRFTSDKAVDFMAHMGLIAAMCLQNSAIKEQIRLLSMMDNLTQVKNRRCFDNDINKEVSRAQRSGQPLSCLFIDADHFKNINDTYGHQAGDETLRSLAAWVKTQLREADQLARYGGEEFAILLPDCDEALAYQVAERVREYVAAQIIPFEGVDISITLSIGVSTYNAKDFAGVAREQAIKALLGRADAAVYDAKQNGRNQVCVREFELNMPSAVSG